MAKQIDILEFIIAHPGLSVYRLRNAFRSDVRASLDKLAGMGALRVEIGTLDDKFREGKLYFPITLCSKCKGRIVLHKELEGEFDLRCLMCRRSILRETNGG